jgi:phenylacetate-CoA ligase
MVKLQKKVVAKLQSVIGISPNIILSEPRSIERSQGKAKRVLDKRKFQ